ncbi:MAG: carboxypeptidase regulatory-like domain-containing protein [Candidatus Omnitrophota bacterium]|nr:carboxypeptidase regulatory-like domain-containing protein [Candidatus Omnitrophota bacterium]
MKRGLKAGGLAVMVLTLLAAGNKPQEAAAVRPAEAAPAGGATLSGSISVTGNVPAPTKIKMAADPACAQAHPDAVMSRELVASNGKLQNVLVYVKDGVTGSFPAPTEAVVINQTGCMYEPHVFGIQAGQKLEILNSDATLHNVNCQPKLNKKFNLAQPTKGMKSAKTFDQPEVPVPFKCNVHPWMTAYAGVFGHPFFAVSGADGAFSISNLPAGTYTLEAWHEKLGAKTQTVTIAEGESKKITFSFEAK